MTVYAPDPHLWWTPRILLRVEVGSTAHGTGLPGGEDHDELAVYADPYDSMVGVDPPARTITHRPGRTEGERSQPGDYDLVAHPARKFCRLAAQGNPSLLMALYGPVMASTPLGDDLRDNAAMFYSDRAHPPRHPPMPPRPHHPTMARLLGTVGLPLLPRARVT